ncbi:MAG: anthranilate phosphoribosyltransferase, partial [Bacteroidetes bacterium]|nr:anthranilate phosphoribosyltransferase [Bacteroidota bacterium]
MMKDTLQYLFDQRTLGRDDAKLIMTNMAGGKYNDPEIAAFISVYLMRSITVEELTGFRDALLELCSPVDLSEFNTIDVCGTGGDEKNTFNISTLTSFVVAAAGEKVAKHGNYSVSSACGSSNVLEYYGYSFSSDPDRLKREIDRYNICFLHAPLFNPAMKNVAPVRRSLRIKTFFNMLGPMVNPSSPGNQMVGVFSLDVARLYHYLYQESGKKYCIIHSLDGYDEISLTGSFKALTLQTERTLVPADIGFTRVEPGEIFGGSTVEEAAGIFLKI